jgi:hypothetical protein
MSSSLLTGLTSLISLETLCSLALVIGLAMAIKPNPLGQLLQHGGQSLKGPADGVIPSRNDTSKQNSHVNDPSKGSNPKFHSSTKPVSESWVMISLRVAAVLALLYLSTIGLTTSSRHIYGMILPIRSESNLTCQ